MTSPTRRTLLCVCSLPLLLFFLLPASGQSTGGRVIGKVSDSTGAVVSGVNVKLTNTATGVTREATTTDTGDYTFVEVAPGSYRVEYTLQGFKKFVRDNVTLEVNQVVTLNATLQAGGTQEVVEVTSEAPLVDTSSTQLGAVVDNRSVEQLPLNQRDTYQFLQLQPGVVSPFASGTGGNIIYGSDQTGAVSVNGGRGRSNNFSVNGGDANDLFVNLPAVQPTPDSIQEFRVLTNTFDAEYGRNSGSVVNVVTKAGTNNLHGDVYEYFRNDKLNARNYFEEVRPEFRQNQFGGTLGGPIQKDRTFFFASYEGRRIRTPSASSTIPVPTAAERQGDFSEGFAPGDPNFPTFSGTLTNSFALANRPGCQTAVNAIGGGPITDGVTYASIFPNNQVPIACMDPVALDLLQFVPLPNRGAGSNLFQSTVIGRTRGDQFTARVDHRINDHQNFTGYYYFNDDYQTQPFAFFEFAGANVPGFGSVVAERFQQANLTHTWTLNNTTVNEARFTYMREGQGKFQHPQNTEAVINSCPPSLSGQPAVTDGPSGNCFNDPANPKLGITPNLGPNREGLPFVQISGGFIIGNNSEGELPQAGNTFEWADNLTKVAGKHTFKFGADVRRMRFDQQLFFDVSGEYFYFGGGPNDTGFQNLYPNYLLGLPDEYGQGSSQRENVRSTGVSLFAQDSWKATRSITLNYGLRWELTTPIADVGHRVQTFRPGQADTVFPCQLIPNNPSSQSLISTFGSSDCSPTGPANAVFPLGLVVPGDKGVPNGLTQTYYKAFAPRVGLAWSPGGSGKTSIRTGFGLFYNPVEQLVLEQFSAEPPFGGSSFVFNTLFDTPFLGQDGATVNPNPFNGVLAPKPGQNVDWSVFRPILLFGEFQPNMRTQYADQYNLTVERELTKDMVLQVGYVGTQGHRLLASQDVNYSNPQTCLDLNATLGAGTCGQFLEDSPFFIPPNTTIAPQGLHLPYGPNGPSFVPGGTVVGPNGITLVGLRRYSSPLCDPMTGNGCPPDGIPVFSDIFAQNTIANSAYNSLQASLEKRFGHGLQFEAAYTFSKSIDQASSFENLLNPINPRASRALSLFDATHRFVFSYFWQPPIPKYNGAAGKVLDDWAVSGITTFQTGFPIRITSQADNELLNSFDFETVGEPDQLKAFKTQNAHNGGCALGTGPTSLEGAACSFVPNLYFDPNTFTENASVDPSLFGRIGNASRTICCGPGIVNFDFSIQKEIVTSESTHLEFRGELFNAFNHTQFLNPDGNTTDGSTFGEVTQARAPRLVQFALKFFF